MGVHCQIHLERQPNDVYIPGSVVRGAVKYAIDVDTAYKDIVICLRGKGHCSWTERSSSDKSDDTYHGTEEYVNVRKSVLEKITDEDVTLKAGAYSHQFSFALPTKIPPSYSDHDCKITYYVKLTFFKTGIFKFNKTFRTELPVRSIIEMTLPGEPIIYGAQKSLMSLTKSNNNLINLKATIKKSLLAPGETAEMDIEVTNDTDKKISAVEITLIREVTYISDTGRENYNFYAFKELKHETQGVKERCTANLQSTLQMPIGHCTIQHSKILKRDYKLKLRVKLPLPHRDLILYIPVLLGDADVEDAKEVKEDGCLDMGPLPEEPPPSYWEVMAEDKIEEKS